MNTIAEAFLHLALLFTSVVAIILKHRFSVEKGWRNKFGIDRDWWIPVLAILVGLSISLFSVETITRTVYDKIDIIILIFTFGLLAEGLQESGVFRYIAYSVADICDENTHKLIIGLFIATSALTLLTTNDVIVLVLTPILIEIAYQANIKNVKLLLLSQFIAANTLSMGLIIGSPTNIIISESLSIGFSDYVFLMIMPAIVAFSSSLLILAISLKYSLIPISSPKREYTSPSTSKPEFTYQMKIWSTIFGIFLVLVAIVTELDQSLLFCSIPTIILALLYWKYDSNTNRSIKQPVSNLPYGVFFFGLSFFVFARSFSSLQIINTTLVPFINQTASTPLSTALSSIVGSGILVNIFNDLPASALIAEILPLVDMSGTKETIFIQGTLAGLNIGAYVTQVGALAGIIWFNEIRKQSSRYDIEFNLPDRHDLIKYGILNFIIATAFLTIFLILEWTILTI